MWYRTVLLSFLSSIAFADGVPRADSHAPIGVMGEHVHKQGEWMLSYRYMEMDYSLVLGWQMSP